MADVAPSGLVLRAGRPEDYSTFARLFLELGVGEPPPAAEVWEAELRPLSLFCEGPEGPRAYAVTDVLGELGYVVQLVVDPTARRQGLGRWMMEALAARFRERGCKRWGLNVKRDNSAALTLYASLGMRPLREFSSLTVSRVHLEAFPAAPEGFEVVPLVETEWEPVTEAFQMMPGKLARFAQRASHQLLRLERVGEPEPLRLGMMDLRSGGVLFPFFASTPEHARVLLEEAFRRAGLEALHVSVTDATPVAALLRGAGAAVEMELLELRGPLLNAAPVPPGSADR